MMPPIRSAIAAILALLLAPAAGAAPPTPTQIGRPMTQKAVGHFDIDLKPDGTLGDGIGKYAFTKQFHGDLDGASVGEMLGYRTQVAGSAGYVVLEQFTGTLKGKSGGFVLQHFGLMDRGTPTQTIKVVPDSGTGELTGIVGEMTIDAAAGHGYVFSYDLK